MAWLQKDRTESLQLVERIAQNGAALGALDTVACVRRGWAPQRREQQVQFESPRFQGDQLLLDILNDDDTAKLKLGPGSPPESVMRLQAALFDMNWTVEAGVTTSDGLPHTPGTFVSSGSTDPRRKPRC